MSKRDLLLEIGTEELPAGFVPRALNLIEGLLKKELATARLAFDGVRTLGTPRRLVFVVEGLGEVQPDVELEVKGPKRQAAFDAEGKPTKALIGFAKGQGVDPADVEIVKTEKGEHVLVKKHVVGEKSEKILPEILARLLLADIFPKSMRWGSGEVSFGRPVHWLLALFGDKPLKFSFGHIESGSITYGHRFMGAMNEGRPAAIEIKNIDGYFKALEGASVIVDPGERAEIIKKGLAEAAAAAGGELLRNDALVDEVVNLVEFPVVLKGGFEEEFLALPSEVIVNAMSEHQRYFSVVKDDGSLLPAFLTVANTDAKESSVVVKGNERVLRARLSDAKFYFDQDVSTRMDDWVEKLKGVVFQAKLGTSYEKVERFTSLAALVGEEIKYSDPEKLKRAAWLSKADLVSGIVGEFPKLQGVMGGIYAARSGEAKEVVEAIREHYMPVAAGGELPATDAGAIVSIADKMDTIAGCFGVGLLPTGAKDPYALRRASLGILAILRDKGFNTPLNWLIRKAVDGIGEKLTKGADEVTENIIEFFKERLKNQLLNEGLSFDSIDAILSTDWYDLVDSVERVKAIEAFKSDPDCARLVVAFKRVSNILKGQETAKAPDQALFTDDHERALFETRERIAPNIEACWEGRDYEAALKELTSIKEAIDTFFDEVMVMVDDEAVKANRLALLASVRELYFRMADLSKLSVGEG